MEILNSLFSKSKTETKSEEKSEMRFAAPLPPNLDLTPLSDDNENDSSLMDPGVLLTPNNAGTWTNPLDMLVDDWTNPMDMLRGGAGSGKSAFVIAYEKKASELIKHGMKRFNEKNPYDNLYTHGEEFLNKVLDTLENMLKKMTRIAYKKHGKGKAFEDLRKRYRVNAADVEEGIIKFMEDRRERLKKKKIASRKRKAAKAVVPKADRPKMTKRRLNRLTKRARKMVKYYIIEGEVVEDADRDDIMDLMKGVKKVLINKAKLINNKAVRESKIKSYKRNYKNTIRFLKGKKVKDGYFKAPESPKLVRSASYNRRLAEHEEKKEAHKERLEFLNEGESGDLLFGRVAEAPPGMSKAGIQRIGRDLEELYMGLYEGAWIMPVGKKDAYRLDLNAAVDRARQALNRAWNGEMVRDAEAREREEARAREASRIAPAVEEKVAPVVVKKVEIRGLDESDDEAPVLVMGGPDIDIPVELLPEVEEKKEVVEEAEEGSLLRAINMFIEEEKDREEQDAFEPDVVVKTPAKVKKAPPLPPNLDTSPLEVTPVVKVKAPVKQVKAPPLPPNLDLVPLDASPPASPVASKKKRKRRRKGEPPLTPPGNRSSLKWDEDRMSVAVHVPSANKDKWVKYLKKLIKYRYRLKSVKKMKAVLYEYKKDRHTVVIEFKHPILARGRRDKTRVQGVEAVPVVKDRGIIEMHSRYKFKKDRLYDTKTGRYPKQAKNGKYRIYPNDGGNKYKMKTLREIVKPLHETKEPVFKAAPVSRTVVPPVVERPVAKIDLKQGVKEIRVDRLKPMFEYGETPEGRYKWDPRDGEQLIDMKSGVKKSKRIKQADKKGKYRMYFLKGRKYKYLEWKDIIENVAKVVKDVDTLKTVTEVHQPQRIASKHPISAPLIPDIDKMPEDEFRALMASTAKDILADIAPRHEAVIEKPKLVTKVLKPFYKEPTSRTKPPIKHSVEETAPVMTKIPITVVEEEVKPQVRRAMDFTLTDSESEFSDEEEEKKVEEVAKEVAKEVVKEVEKSEEQLALEYKGEDPLSKEEGEKVDDLADFMSDEMKAMFADMFENEKAKIEIIKEAAESEDKAVVERANQALIIENNAIEDINAHMMEEMLKVDELMDNIESEIDDFDALEEAEDEWHEMKKEEDEDYRQLDQFIRENPDAISNHPSEKEKWDKAICAQIEQDMAELKRDFPYDPELQKEGRQLLAACRHLKRLRTKGKFDVECEECGETWRDPIQAPRVPSGKYVKHVRFTPQTPIDVKRGTFRSRTEDREPLAYKTPAKDAAQHMFRIQRNRAKKADIPLRHAPRMLTPLPKPEAIAEIAVAHPEMVESDSEFSEEEDEEIGRKVWKPSVATMAPIEVSDFESEEEEVPAWQIRVDQPAASEREYVPQVVEEEEESEFSDEEEEEQKGSGLDFPIFDDVEQAYLATQRNLFERQELLRENELHVQKLRNMKHKAKRKWAKFNKKRAGQKKLGKHGGFLGLRGGGIGGDFDDIEEPCRDLMGGRHMPRDDDEKDDRNADEVVRDAIEELENQEANAPVAVKVKLDGMVSVGKDAYDIRPKISEVGIDASDLRRRALKSFADAIYGELSANPKVVSRNVHYGANDVGTAAAFLRLFRNAWVDERLLLIIEIQLVSNNGVPVPARSFIESRVSMGTVIRKLYHLQNHREVEAEEQYSSGAQAMLEILKGFGFRLTMVLKNRYTRVRGGYFPFYHKFDLNLEHLQVYKLGSNMKPKLNCLEYAVVKQLRDLIEDDDVFDAQRAVVSTFVRDGENRVDGRNLKKLATLLERDIYLTKIRNDGRNRKIGHKSKVRTRAERNEALELGYIADHYFRNDKKEWVTLYALENMEAIKDSIGEYEDWEQMSGKNENGYFSAGTKSMKSMALLKHLYTKMRDMFEFIEEEDPVVLDIKEHKPYAEAPGNELLKMSAAERMLIKKEVDKGGSVRELAFRFSKVNPNAFGTPMIKEFKDFTELSAKDKANILSKAETRVSEYVPESEERGYEVQNKARISMLNKEPEMQKRLVEQVHAIKGGDIKELARRYKSILERLDRFTNAIGVQEVTYYKLACGRRQALGGNGIQGESRALRGLFCRDYYMDIDMKNAHPVILLHLLKKKKIKFPALKEYVNNRDGCIKDIIELNDGEISRADIKKAYLVMQNGGRYFVDKLEEKFEFTENFMDFGKQIHGVIDKFIESEFEEYKEFALKEAHENPKITYVAYKVMHVENQLLRFATDRFKKSGVIVNDFYTNIYDGFQFVKTLIVNDLYMKLVLEDFNVEVEKYFGMKMIFANKKIEESIKWESLTTPELDVKYGRDENGYYKGEKTANWIMENLVLCDKNEVKKYNVVFADYETDTSWFNKKTGKTQHKEYSVHWVINDEKEAHTAIGKHCTEDLLEAIPDLSLVICHNMNYDIKFLAGHERVRFVNSDKLHFNGKFIHCMMTYLKLSGEVIRFKMKCSAALIRAKLSKFPSMFGLKALEKEAYPYEAYSTSNINDKCMEIAKAVECKHFKNNPDDVKVFLHNIDSHGWNNRDGTFDHIAYNKFYGERDVMVTRAGYNKNRDLVMKQWEEADCSFALDIDKVATSSSMADKYIRAKGAYRYVKKDRGVKRAFAQRAVFGGRTYSMENKMFRVEADCVFARVPGGDEELYYRHECDIKMRDFDAVGLYASSMAIMPGFPKGSSEVIHETNLNMAYLNDVDYYVVKIWIESVGRHRRNPVFPLRTDGLALYDDSLWPGQYTYVGKVGLEEMIEYHKIKFKICEGMYWNDGFNPIVNSCMRNLQAKRLIAKKEKNPIQRLIKGNMNDCFGKSITKPIESHIEIFNDYECWIAFITSNYLSIEYSYQIEGTEKRIVKIKDDINEHESYPHVGGLILDQSKRIMNRVMCLAEDHDLHIWYQDTDSMHIIDEHLTKLIALYNAKYKCELVGKDLTQFHNDFDCPAKFAEAGFEPYAVDTVILGKKAYAEKIICNSKGDYDWHIRMKGISRDAIDLEVSITDGDYHDLYMRMYWSQKTTFNMGQSGVKFQNNEDLTVETMVDFSREVHFLPYERPEIAAFPEPEGEYALTGISEDDDLLEMLEILDNANFEEEYADIEEAKLDAEEEFLVLNARESRIANEYDEEEKAEIRCLVRKYGAPLKVYINNSMIVFDEDGDFLFGV